MAITTLKLDGRLDTARVGQVETAFAARAGAVQAGGEGAIIDLSEVTYISSLGMRLLVTTLKQFSNRGIRFATVRPREALVNDTLAIANLTALLNMADDPAAAAAQLAALPKA